MVVCLNCGKRPEFRCAGCGVARFCCQACQRACWKGHRPHCGLVPDLTAKDLVENVPEAFASAWPEEEQQSDALLLAQLLKALGVCKDGRILGQQPLLETELWEHITKSRRGLAALLFGRNCFRTSLLPAVRALSALGQWPLLLSARPQGHVTELPTLELCATLAWRVLAAARRLRAKGHRRLIFLGIGSGDSLVEASVTLHLAAALGVTPDLEKGSPLSLPWDDFEIEVVTTDSADDEDLRLNRIAEAPSELRSLRLDRRAAVRRFAAEAPLFVFSSWMPMHACWCSDVVEDAGSRLVEMCFLTSPPELIQVPRQEVLRPATPQLRATQEINPLTLCRWDFLAEGFDEAGEETDRDFCNSGLFHSQLYITSSRQVPPLPLPRTLLHSFGCYHKRMAADPQLMAVNVCRGVGLYHIRGPKDLGASLPGPELLSLRQEYEVFMFKGQGLKHFLDLLCHGWKAALGESPSSRAFIAQCVRFLEGAAKKQVEQVLAEAGYRI
eukprot:s31_g16.t3